MRPPIGTDRSGQRTVSFAPDGNTFVIARGGQVQLWDPDTGTQVARIEPGRPGFSASAVFHPDGHTVVVATSDGGVYLWDTSVEAAIAAACAETGRNMNLTEWREAFPDRPYRETCPAN